MNLVLEAARITEARFASLASVVGNNPITGSLTWKNNRLTAGVSRIVGYILGKFNAATGTFSPYGFTVGGVTYFYGSAVASTAPAVGSSKTDAVRSYALNVAAITTYDAYCFIASGTLRTYNADYGVGARPIGLHYDDFMALGITDSKVFTNVLTVSPA